VFPRLFTEGGEKINKIISATHRSQRAVTYPLKTTSGAGGRVKQREESERGLEASYIEYSFHTGGRGEKSLLEVVNVTHTSVREIPSRIRERTILREEKEKDGIKLQLTRKTQLIEERRRASTAIPRCNFNRGRSPEEPVSLKGGKEGRLPR